jgi:MtaA/CmuA family methyltransferase
MTAKERFLSALIRTNTGNPPFHIVTQTATVELMDACGAHWPDVHYDVELMTRLAMAAHTEWGVPSVRVPFCMTVEAEALGCEVKRGAVDIQPSVFDGMEEPAKLGELDISAGRLPVVLESVRNLKGEVGDDVPVLASFVGPFTLAGHVLDVSRMMVNILKKPEEIMDVIEKCAAISETYGAELARSGADALVMLEPSASTNLIGPPHFEKFAAPYISRVVDALKPSPVILHICGRTQPIISMMAGTGATALSIEEEVDVAAARKDVPEAVLVGNLSTSNVLLSGTPEQVEEAAVKVLGDGIDVLAPGCGVAPRTPGKNIKAAIRASENFVG